MTTLRKVEILGLLAALLVAALFLRGWIAERDARNSAEAFAKAQTVKADTLAAQISASKNEASAYEAGKAAEAASITTPQQAVKIITQYLPVQGTGNGEQGTAAALVPALPIPIIPANELEADLSASLRAKLAPAPSYEILTEDQTKAIARNDLACDADRHTLAACSVQLRDETQIAALTQAKADKFEQAMKGGTWKQRVGKVLKSAACAGGGAAIAALATRNAAASTQFGSVAVGAAGGAIACSIF